MKIAECLDKYHQMFPNNGQYFSFKKTCCFASQSYFSYSNEKDWDIVTLNVIQIFLRNVVGMYPQTHFSHVYKAWSKIEKSHSPAFDQQIQAKWGKINILMFGNTKPGEAQVFCFPEKHDDVAYHKYTASIIHKYYQPGDVVLVEGVRAEEAPSLNAFRIIDKACEIKGWEPELSQALMDKSFKTVEEKLAEIDKLRSDFLACLPKREDYVDADFVQFEQQLPSLLERFFKLAKFVDREDFAKKVALDIPGYLELVKQKKLVSKNNNLNGFSYLILKFLEEIGSQMQFKAYDHIDQESFKEILEVHEKRNLSLCHEIEKYVQMKKKVFVVAGAAHLVELDLLKGKTQCVKDTLNRQAYTMYITRELFNKSDIRPHNQDLVPVISA